MTVVHYEHPHMIVKAHSAVAVWSACGSPGPTQRDCEDVTALVTCKSCRRTRVFRVEDVIQRSIGERSD